MRQFNKRRHQKTYPLRRQSALMKRFSTLAGLPEKIDSSKSYHVAFKSIISNEKFVYRLWTKIVAYSALVLVLLYGVFLFQPSHWMITIDPSVSYYNASLLMLVCLFLLQLFLVIGTYAATRSTLKAKDPVPVKPANGLRVAFATTRAPGEPIDMVETTLIAAKQVKYVTGTVDVWLLDETADPELIELCHSIGVRYFSRKNIIAWNAAKPTSRIAYETKDFMTRIRSFGKKSLPAFKRQNPFLAAKSKHGNFNSWLEYLASSGIKYDILAGVDTDQVPEKNYLERLLGYFRDQDVAYVVGPQVYGNYKTGLQGLVARWAESQASFFQSTIQRAGNATGSPMFVGTNYAVRMSVLEQIGGFQHCITEDMATGLVIHSNHNPITGKRWKSVYTPDVLAIGEGPDFWGPYFSQQWRWAAGTFDTWRHTFRTTWYKLPPKVLLNYLLMLTFYPMAALTWLIGIISSMTYLITGATALSVPWNQFIALYLMLLTMQMSLYFWNRLYNVSPHEPAGSFGVAGMFVSTLTAPIYLSAFIGMLIGKKANFVVTSKGGSDNPDWISTFKTHLLWGGMLLAGLIYGIANGHAHPAMIIWVASQLVICIVPFTLGMLLAVPERYKWLSRSFTRRTRHA